MRPARALGAKLETCSTCGAQFDPSAEDWSGPAHSDRDCLRRIEGRRREMDRARNEALAARSLARAVWAAGAVLALAVIACVLVALLVTGCARPSAPVVELQEGGAPPPPPSLGDPCDCAYALAACAPSGYRCGVGVACADGIPYRRTDAGISLVSKACPVPLTDRGRVVALCLDGDACVVDAATGDVAPWRDGP